MRKAESPIDGKRFSKTKARIVLGKKRITDMEGVSATAKKNA